MPEWAIGLLVEAAAGLLALGGMFWRLQRLEKDQADCVKRETYAAERLASEKHITRIELYVERIWERLTGYSRTPRPGEDTDPGRIPR